MLRGADSRSRASDVRVRCMGTRSGAAPTAGDRRPMSAIPNDTKLTATE